jgi:hypothetical protein
MENRKLLKKVAIPIAILIILLFYTAVYFYMISAWGDHFTQWILFHDKEIKGSIVDADTGASIEGAVVVGLWALTEKCGGEGFCGYAKIIETATDKDGAFVVRAWKTFKPWKFYCLLHEHAPKIVIYKPGYRVYGPHEILLSNYWERYGHIQGKMNITPAKLKRIYTDEEKAKNILETRSSIQIHMLGEGLNKKDIMLVLKALEEERQGLSVKFKNKIPKNY